MTLTPSFAVTRNPLALSEEERARLMVSPAFGRVFTDHMAVVDYSVEKGWHDPRVQARAAITLDPAAAVFHYAQEIFEGLKAYRTDDGSIAMFRPEENAKRFRTSAARLAMAQLPEEV